MTASTASASASLPGADLCLERVLCILLLNLALSVLRRVLTSAMYFSRSASVSGVEDSFTTDMFGMGISLTSPFDALRPTRGFYWEGGREVDIDTSKWLGREKERKEPILIRMSVKRIIRVKWLPQCVFTGGVRVQKGGFLIW